MSHRQPQRETHRFFELPPWLWEAPHAAAQTFLVVREAVRRVLFEETLALHAAAIAYYGLLSFVPVILVVLSLSSFILSGRQDLQEVLRSHLVLVFPSSHEELMGKITEFAASYKVYGLVGLLGLLWSGSRVFASLDISLNDIWRVKKTRPYWHHRLLSIGLVPLLLVLFMGLLAITSLQSLIDGFTLNGVPVFADSPILSDFTRYVAPPLLSWLVLFLLYWFLPSRKILVRSALIGSFVAAALWQIARLGFEYYLRSFDKMDAVYGAAAGLVILMLWIYYSAMTLLVGAVVGAADLDRRLSQSARRTVKKKGKETA